MMRGRPRGLEVIPREQAAIVGTNIRTLRQGRGWPQNRVSALMGWSSNSTVCAAEGHRGGRQRSFTPDEVQRLAEIFGVKVWQLTTRRELRRPSPGRVRLPDLRSTSHPHRHGYRRGTR